MRCKDCREKIPDNVKYCPECGALVNDIKYTINNNTVFATQPVNTPVSPSVQQESQNAPQTKRYPDYRANQTKKMARNGIIALFAIIFLCIAISVVYEEFSSTINSFSDNDEFSVEYTTIEDVAYSYVYNILDAADMPYYDDFNYYTTIDWDCFFADLTGDEDGYTRAQETYNSFTAENKLFDSLPDEYEYYIVYTESVTESEYTDNHSYINMFDSLIRPLSLSSVNYIPYSDIQKISIVSFGIDFYDEKDELITSEYVDVTVVCQGASYYSSGYYDVLYDNFFMDDFITSLYTEEALSYIQEENTDF